jgi:hypothetical protein
VTEKREALQERMEEDRSVGQAGRTRQCRRRPKGAAG